MEVTDAIERIDLETKQIALCVKCSKIHLYEMINREMNVL